MEDFLRLLEECVGILLLSYHVRHMQHLGCVASTFFKGSNIQPWSAFLQANLELQLKREGARATIFFDRDQVFFLWRVGGVNQVFHRG